MNILVASVVKLLCNHKLSSSKGQTSGTHSQYIPQKHVVPQLFLNTHWSIIFVIVNGHVSVVRAESGKVSGTTCLSQEEHAQKYSLEDALAFYSSLKTKIITVLNILNISVSCV